MPLPAIRNPFTKKPLPLKRRESLESGPSSSEVVYSGEPKKLGEKKREEAVKLVTDRFELSQSSRSQFEGQWAMALSYYNGRQWVDWDPEKGLQDVRDKTDKRWYRTVNLIKPLCKIATARITSNRPDVQVLPRSSDRELDEAAAKELRLVIEHYNTTHKFRLILQRMATYAWMATTAFLWQYWDPNAMADVAVEWDEEGAPTKYEARRVGNYREQFVPGHEVYADPRCTSWDECQWMIHVQRMTNEDIEATWGAPASPGDSRKSTNMGSLFDSFVSPWGSQTDGKTLNQQLVKRMYEAPSVRYPEGREIIVCGSECLEYREALPCSMIPLLPMGSTQGIGTPYHSGTGSDLLGPQSDYNLLRSRVLGALRDQKLTVVREKGDQAGADLADVLSSPSFGIDETPRVREIWHKRGFSPPSFTLPPMLDFAKVTGFMSDLRQEMAEMSGVHRVSSGAGDPNATSGISIRLLKDADETSGSEFSHEVEVFLEQRGTRIGIIVSKYVEEKRAWELDDKNNPSERELVYSGLEALKMGMASVRVVEGSATPRTPEAEDAQLMEMYNGGLLGDPADPDVRELVLSLLHSPLAYRAHEGLEKAKLAKLETQAIEAELEASLGSGLTDVAGASPEMPMPPSDSAMPETPPSLEEFLAGGGQSPLPMAGV